jgi:outer membrane protein assembly factor BamB
MKLNKIAKKTIAIWSVLLLIFSLNFSFNATAEIIKDKDDGVAFDEFNNGNDITLRKCDLSNGSIRLMNIEFDRIFDRKNTPTLFEAYKHASPLIKPSGGIIQYISSVVDNPESLISTPDSDEYSYNEYSNIENIDDNLVETEGGKFYLQPWWPINLYRFKTGYKKSNVDEYELAWNLGKYNLEANLEKITMYVWSYGDLLPHWTHIKTLNYTELEITAVDGWISSVRRNTNFIGNNGIIDMLIVGVPEDNDDPAYLHSDYAMLHVNVKKGFVPEGNVTSGPIEPEILNGWERVIWSGSRPSANSEVRIKILDEDGKVIESIEGNSDGFTYSPIDITSLDIDEYPIIRLKAFLKSDNIKFSPRLNSWGVLWQTADRFHDSFSYDFRINESFGVNIEGGSIKISEFYSDWEIFGKNPENTRSYIGQEIKVGKNQTYWYTSDEENYGGGFRCPVVKDGKVYIASANKKIYIFNLTTEDPDDEHFSFDESSANYIVDGSVAVTDNSVIVATSQTGSINQIYALNNSNLTDVFWVYNDDSEDTICYSSPTIANDRIFITSWSGKLANNPMLNSIYSKFNNFLKRFGIDLGDNNFLIGLGINGGELWDPKSLPAASFCTPAVHNGLVYVGCMNYDGQSFFAFDENSGEEIWNASIGIIGRSSPVVADGKVYVVSREQSLFSFRGNDTIYALDAETGEMVWNKTIGNSTNVLYSYIQTINIANRLSITGPVATPAYYEGTLFIMTSEGILRALNGNTGEEIWTFDAAGETPGLDILPYHTASPVVVDNIVYIATTSLSHVYALDNSNNGEIIWDYIISDPEFAPGYIQFHYTFASPIMTDGLVLISEIQKASLNASLDINRIQCIGTYENNTEGKVISVPIHVQKGKWWNKFNASTTNNDPVNNSIEFSILNENGDILASGLNGDNNLISDIKDNIIQLCAEFKIRKVEQDYPVLNNWSLSWNIEDKEPEFIANSFKAGEGQEGWINLIEHPECSIKVRDKGVNSIISGIDIESAEYYLQYVKEGSNSVTSKWFNAVSDEESGSTEATIIADIPTDLKEVKIKELKNITFRIKDLAGNQNTSETITFKLDNVKPSSTVKDADSYEDKYNSIQIEATGNDDKSGIASISLYYRPSSSTDWIQYGSKKSPYIWSFENDTSDVYEFCTVAKDKAGNTESFPSSPDVEFLFDMNPPSKPDFNNYYTFDTLPEFSLTFEDDYELLSIEYKLNFHGENEWINISNSINKKTYKGEWTLLQSDWDMMFEDVKHTMHFRITDYCGNEYITPSDKEALNLSKDIIPPITVDVSLVLTEFEENGFDNKFTITATLPADMEYEYVSLYYTYSSDNKDFSDWERYGDELTEVPFKWNFEAEEGSGYYKFKTRIYNEGEIVESREKIINVTIFPTALVTILTFLIFILLLFVIISMRKIKSR